MTVSISQMSTSCLQSYGRGTKLPCRVVIPCSVSQSIIPIRGDHCVGDCAISLVRVHLL